VKFTPARWIFGCLLGCALLAITFLPAGPNGDDPTVDYWWRSPIRIREDAIRPRYNALWRHTILLSRSYKAATDVETANRVFGAHHETSGNPILWFGPDISQGVRARVEHIIGAERAARGESAGRGAVGVMVVSDTATMLGGVKMPSLFDRDRALITAVLPATRQNGNHCVTVIRLRHRALTQTPAELSTDRLALDGCAFTDAFGAPGPQIGDWLKATRYTFARRLSYAANDSLMKRRWNWFDEGDEQSRRCRGGIDSACVASAASNGRYDDWFGWRPPDLSVPTPDESAEEYGELNSPRDSYMEGLARDLGAARFQRMWRSAKPLPDAYFDETGQSFASWVRGRELEYHGPYHIGPMQPPSSAFLTILSVLVLAAITIRFAPRPYKI
jgi:hypothetical protein